MEFSYKLLFENNARVNMKKTEEKRKMMNKKKNCLKESSSSSSFLCVCVCVCAGSIYIKNILMKKLLTIVYYHICIFFIIFTNYCTHTRNSFSYFFFYFYKSNKKHIYFWKPKWELRNFFFPNCAPLISF